MFGKEMDNEMDNAMGDLIIQLAADRPLKPIHQRITAADIHSASTTTPSCHKGPLFVSPLVSQLGQKRSNGHLP